MTAIIHSQPNLADTHEKIRVINKFSVTLSGTLQQKMVT